MANYRKLTTTQAKELKILLGIGVPRSLIADRYGITIPSLKAIETNKSYSEVHLLGDEQERIDHFINQLASRER